MPIPLPAKKLAEVVLHFVVAFVVAAVVSAVLATAFGSEGEMTERQIELPSISATSEVAKIEVARERVRLAAERCQLEWRKYNGYIRHWAEQLDQIEPQLEDQTLVAVLDRLDRNIEEYARLIGEPASTDMLLALAELAAAEAAVPKSRAQLRREARAGVGVPQVSVMVPSSLFWPEAFDGCFGPSIVDPD
jgi:hypothetical protein